MNVPVRGMIVLLGCYSTGIVNAQMAPQSYGSYYQRNAGQGTRTNVTSYLYDKYFYRSPAVSPYVNLGRGAGLGGDAYSTYVQPELQRREQAASSMRSYVQQRKTAGNVGHTVYSNALGQTSYRPAPSPPRYPNSNPYFMQYYGGVR